MRKNVWLLGTLAVVVASTLTACRPHGPPNPERMNKYLTMGIEDRLDDLDATPEQTSAVLAVKDRLFPQGVKLFEDNRAVKKEAFELWKQDRPDASRAHALVDQRMDAFRAFAHELVDGVIEVHGILTPAQRGEINEKIADRLER